MMKQLTVLFLTITTISISAYSTPPCIPGMITSIEGQGDTVCTGVSVSFSNNSDLGGESLTFKQWNFGDGSNPVNLENTTHIYTQSGTFTVTFNLASASCTGLMVQRTITVIDPPMGLAFGTDASCFGLCDGTTTMDIQIAPHGNYSFLWDDPNTQTTAIASGLCASTYSVTITDNYGCTTFFNASVSEPDEIIVEAGNDIFICEGSQWPLSEADLISGGVGNVQYSWEPGFALDDPTQLNPILDVDDASDFGVYTLTIIDDDGCSGSDDLQVLQTPGAIHGTVTNPGTGSVMEGVVVSLIKRGNDDTQWETYDTYTTVGDGMFHFINLPLVDYIVKAEVPGSPDFIDTYYHPSDIIFDWEEAQVTSVGCGEMIFNTDIEMIAAPGGMGGDCTFEGMVYLVTCDNPPCKTQTEDPIPLIDVIVKKTPPGNAVAWTQTGVIEGVDEGKFTFTGVDVDSLYSFVINVPGLTMQENHYIEVELDDIAYNGLNFYVDTTPGTGGIFTYNPLGVEAIKRKPREMVAYPNPFTENCELRFTNIENTGFTFTLFDVTGKQIMRDQQEQGNTYIINTQQFDQGIYIAEVNTGNEVYRTRVMKK